MMLKALRILFGSHPTARLTRRKWPKPFQTGFFQPRIERLEDRVMPSVVTPFTPRFTINDTGDITIAANTLLTATATAGRTPQQVADAQNGTGQFLDNNDFQMGYVDTDNDPSTFDSSQATLTLPSDGTVLFAGLYWGANSSSAARTAVKLSTPNSGGYLDLTGTEIGNTSGLNPQPNPPGNNYEAFADVTQQVSAGGSGSYMVANVQAQLGSNLYAGWALVVVYQSPSQPPRNLTVFDGYSVIKNGDSPVNIPINGFLTPPSGPVNAKIGVVAYEGDLGLTGDSLLLNGTKLSDSQNPADNFFNSAISNLGVSATAKSPNYVNQLGFDAKIVQVPSGLIKNSDTSAVATLQTTSDSYFPGVFTTAIDLFAPNLQTTKTVQDLNGGGVVKPGDTLEYTITTTNQGGDNGKNSLLVDPIPANTHYVPGSLKIVSGANSGSKTDQAGDDQAEFDAVNNQVVFRLGTGATATTGGTLNLQDRSTVTFDVTVDAGTPDKTVILNQVTATTTGVLSNITVTSTDSASATVVNPLADLAVTKTVDDPTPHLGEVVTFTVTLANLGPSDATGVQVTDLLPAGLTFVSDTTSQGTYDSTTGLWDLQNVPFNSSQTLQIQARVDSTNTLTNLAAVSHSDQPDPNPANNFATATVTNLQPTPQADLALAKVVDNATPNVGDNVHFTITLTDLGPDTATNVTVHDQLPAGLTFVSATPSEGTYDSTTGLWTVGTVNTTTAQTLDVIAKVVNPSAQTNTVTITHSDQVDPNPDNNTASATVTPQQADLAVAKTIDNAKPAPGDVIHYTVTITNHGPNIATNVTLTDKIPSGFTFVSATPSEGTYDQTTGVWIVGTINNGANQVLTITATAKSVAAQTNTATISHADQFDPITTNNTASVTSKSPNADMAITKKASVSSAPVGSKVLYTFTVKNNGPGTATNVFMSEAFPTGLTFVSAGNPSQGAFNPTTKFWNVGRLVNGATATLQLVAKITVTGLLVNHAQVSSEETDPNLANNFAQASVTGTAGIVSKTSFLGSSLPAAFVLQASPSGLLGNSFHTQSLIDQASTGSTTGNTPKAASSTKPVVTPEAVAPSTMTSFFADYGKTKSDVISPLAFLGSSLF
jgi:large repetitive protein